MDTIRNAQWLASSADERSSDLSTGAGVSTAPNACRQRAHPERDDERLWGGSDPDPEDVVNVAILSATLRPPHRR